MLGESHYESSEDENATFTSQTVRTWAQENATDSSLSSRTCLPTTEAGSAVPTERTLGSRSPSTTLCRARWTALDNLRRFRLWVDAQQPFKTVLATLRPEEVLFLGRRLDEHLLSTPDDIAFGTLSTRRLRGLGTRRTCGDSRTFWKTPHSGEIGRSRESEPPDRCGCRSAFAMDVSRVARRDRAQAVADRRAIVAGQFGGTGLTMSCWTGRGSAPRTTLPLGLDCAAGGEPLLRRPPDTRPVLHAIGSTHPPHRD